MKIAELHLCVMIAREDCMFLARWKGLCRWNCFNFTIQNFLSI